MGIEARRNENQIRRETLERRNDRVAIGLHEHVIPDASLERHIHGRTGTRTAPALFDTSAAWVEGELVSRRIQHGGIRIEDLLRSIAVMHVDIDDSNTSSALSAQRRRRNGDVVVETESHRPI